VHVVDIASGPVDADAELGQVAVDTNQELAAAQRRLRAAVERGRSVARRSVRALRARGAPGCSGHSRVTVTGPTGPVDGAFVLTAAC
jgi:4'-phosphopantetheinyl transferase EntD